MFQVFCKQLFSLIWKDHKLRFEDHYFDFSNNYLYLPFYLILLTVQGFFALTGALAF